MFTAQINRCFTDTSLPIDTTLPIPGPNVPYRYLQRTTVPYPASPTEPFGTLTDRITGQGEVRQGAIIATGTILVPAWYHRYSILVYTPCRNFVETSETAFVGRSRAWGPLAHIFSLSLRRSKRVENGVLARPDTRVVACNRGVGRGAGLRRRARRAGRLQRITAYLSLSIFPYL